MNKKKMILHSAVLLLAVGVTAKAQEEEEGRRYHFGVRVEFINGNAFKTSTVSNSTTGPAADYIYTGSSDSSRLTGGIGTEVRLWGKFTLGVDLLYRPVQYKQEVSVKAGTAPTSGSDTRTASVYTETTRSNYWDIPITLRYHGLRNEGLLRYVYSLGGIAVQHAGKIRTANDTALANGTTSYNETPAHAAHPNAIGGIVGVGLQFVDAFGMRVQPEVRFTKWAQPNFQGTSFRSSTNQLEVGLGLSF